MQCQSSAECNYYVFYEELSFCKLYSEAVSFKSVSGEGVRTGPNECTTEGMCNLAMLDDQSNLLFDEPSSKILTVRKVIKKIL